MRLNTLLKGLAVLLSLGSTHAAPAPPLQYDIPSDTLSDILNTSDNPNEAITNLLNAGFNIKTKPVCDDSGPSVKRPVLVEAIDLLCSIRNGMTIEAGQTISLEFDAKGPEHYDPEYKSVVELRMTTADGIGAVMVEYLGCAKNFRRIVDECDTLETHFKQGGTLMVGGIRFFIDARSK